MTEYAKLFDTTQVLLRLLDNPKPYLITLRERTVSDILVNVTFMIDGKNVASRGVLLDLAARLGLENVSLHETQRIVRGTFGDVTVELVA